MNTQIQFQTGEHQVYVTTKEFTLPNGRKVGTGTEIKFDGATAIFEGNPPADMYNLRGAVKMGWLVPKTSYDPSATVKPVAAGVKIRPAVGGNPMNPGSREAITTVDAEEQEVGGVEAHAKRTRELNGPRKTKKSSAGQRVTGATMTVDEMEGRVVNRPAFKTATKNEAASLDEAGALISEAENVKVDALPSVVGTVAAPESASKEGITVTNTVGNGIETFDLSGLDKKSPDQVTTIESEGLRFTTTNGPKKSVVQIDKKSEDLRRKVAKAVCPDFPDLYDFDTSLRKKIARIQADFDDRPDVIKAIYAAESDEVKNALVEQFPEAFA